MVRQLSTIRRERHHARGDKRLLDSGDMTESAKPESQSNDPTGAALASLETLDVNGLSFVQLRRLQKSLQQRLSDATSEIARRTAEGSDGDTVNVPVPKV